MSDAPQPARRSFGSRVRRFLLLVVFLAVVLTGLYIWAAWSFAYSEGERAGYVQKFSRKGWICKTWEGELAMANLPGAMPQIFQFTVRDEAVAAEVNRSMGQRVVLDYEQHKGLPTSCFGDTEYFVHKVRPADN
jgi:hypothetical protein